MRSSSSARAVPPSEPVPSGDRARAARATIDALTSAPDVFETFFDEARVGLALADLAGRYIRVNSTYAQLLGRAPEDLVGVFLGEVLGSDASTLVDLVAGRAPSLQAERQYVDVHGESTWLMHGVTTVTGTQGEPAWFAVSAQDVTERRRVELELRELAAALTERAVRDPLTGLANRTLLEERLRACLSRDARSGQSTGVLFLDLDGFKEVNDRYGHSVGDAVLRTVADRLTAAIRPSDTVARLGGDEFVILVEGASERTLDALVARLQAAVAEPMDVGEHDLAVGVSVGRALAHAGAGTTSSLLAHADARMYEAKRTPR